MSALYVDGFENWQDVAREYTDWVYGEDREATALAAIPEPDEVFVAAYEIGNYEGDSFVAFRRGDKFYINTGSHCSCMGLEGQWDPTEYDDRSLFVAYLERIRDHGYSLENKYAPEVLARLPGTQS